MKKGVTDGKYWVKPDNFLHSEMCKWCFDNVGQPDDIFHGTVGQWSINTKRNKLFFVRKVDRDAFIEDWK